MDKKISSRFVSNAKNLGLTGRLHVDQEIQKQIYITSSSFLTDERCCILFEADYNLMGRGVGDYQNTNVIHFFCKP